MTLAEAAVSPPERAAQAADTKSVTACAFCRRTLADEYYFTCLRCHASCCYIHMSRHKPEICARQAGARRRAHAVRAEQRQGQEVSPEQGAAIAMAGSILKLGSSQKP